MKVCRDHRRFFCKECFRNHKYEDKFMRFESEKAADALCDSLRLQIGDRDAFIMSLDNFVEALKMERERDDSED